MSEKGLSESDTEMEPGKTYNNGSLPNIDLQKLSDYITMNVASLVSESNQSLILEALDVGLLKSFAQSSKSQILVVNRFDDESDVRYTMSAKIPQNTGHSVSIVIAKKKPSPIVESPLFYQLSVTLIDGINYNSISAQIGQVFVPYFKSIESNDAIKEIANKLSDVESSISKLTPINYSNGEASISTINGNNEGSDDQEEQSDEESSLNSDESEEEYVDEDLDEIFARPDLSGLITTNDQESSRNTRSKTLQSHNSEPEKKHVVIVSDESDGGESSNLPQNSKPQATTIESKKYVITISDESGQSDGESSNLPQSSKPRPSTTKSTKRRAAIDSDESENESPKTSKKIKKHAAIDSDEQTSLMDTDKEETDERESGEEGTDDEEMEDETDVSKPAKKKRKRVIESEDEEDSSEEVQIIEKPNPKRKLQTTIDAQREERERLKRLAQKQQEFNGIIFDDSNIDIDAALADSSERQKILKELILDSGEEYGQVKVHPSLVRLLKPHQAEGVKFMYDCTIESVSRIGLPGGGGILAHCMGLGKTLQSITFLHTILTNRYISKEINRALIIVPKSVILNWQNEFFKWIFKNDSSMPEIMTFEIDSVKDNKARLNVLKQWFTCKYPSVCIIGYEMFRNLTQDYTKPNKKTGKAPADAPAKKKLVKMQDEFRKYLQNPGPHIVICDEGHKLKSVDSVVSQTTALIATKRRICLTGTPMQNRLGEYYCMVNFVKLNLLGTKAEFNLRFEKPITEGQSKDSDEYQVKLMRRRCHVLHKKLEGIIHRKDVSILKDTLSPKLEYVIHLRLTEKQRKLYQLYLDRECSDLSARKLKMLADYHVFSRIFTHPYQLIVHQEDKNSKNDDFEDDLDGFIVHDSDDSNSRGRSPDRPSSPQNWFVNSDILEEEDREDFTQSYKLLIMVEILKQCEAIGDKVLVFSQSLETLRLIYRMLDFMGPRWFNDGHDAILKKPNEKWGWQRDKDFMVITGDVSSKDRDIVQKQFNRQNNPRNRLCLISTKAGSLGTNFVGANRVIIFDQGWNPSNDRQALSRVYRFGQVKPVYIYRLVAHGTIEDRIYARQVTKESISGRVVDEHQIQRHYLNADLEALYTLNVDEYDPAKAPQYSVPEDSLLANVFLKVKEGVVNCLQHDFLLAHVEEEVLTPEEMQLAWDEFENKRPPPNPLNQANQANQVNQAGRLNWPNIPNIPISQMGNVVRELIKHGVDPAMIQNYMTNLQNAQNSNSNGNINLE